MTAPPAATDKPPPAEGILVVDKPVGPTSFDVIAKLRKSLHTRELGHCGTLDPLASGVLVVVAGRYTKLVRFLTADDKRYTADIAFGTRTTTDDREGEVIERGDPSGLDAPRIEAALRGMTGNVLQVPPMHSAIQKDGERLYEKARRGETVEVEARPVVIHALSLVSWQPPVATVDVHCGKGTYVRAIARDLGAALGVPAHLAGLRRTASGAWHISDAISLEEARDAGRVREHLRTGPLEVRGMTSVAVDDNVARALRVGQRPRLAWPDNDAALAVHDGDIVAIVAIKEGQALVIRGF